MSSLFGKKDVASAALVKEELMKARRADGPWLHAWHDPVAYVKVTIIIASLFVYTYVGFLYCACSENREGSALREK